MSDHFLHKRIGGTKGEEDATARNSIRDHLARAHGKTHEELKNNSLGAMNASHQTMHKGGATGHDHS